MDPHSAVGLSDLHGAVSKHISLDWKVDFDKKIITGNCVIFCQKIKDNATSAVFDTKGLKIHSIADEDGNNLNVGTYITAFKNHLPAIVEVSITRSAKI